MGVMFRYRDRDSFYRFSMDNQSQYRRLIRKVDGKVRLLWEDDVSFTVGREYQIAVDCVGEHLTGYVDGARIFSVKDDRIDTGAVGLYCRANQAARFHELRVMAPANGWVPYHIFGDEEPLPAGTQIEIVERGQSEGSNPEPRHVRRRRNATIPGSLPPEKVYLRMRTPAGEPQHMRQFRRPNEYASVSEDFAVLRSRDGTGVLLIERNGLEEAQYRVTFAPDDTQEHESQLEDPVYIDIPWE